MNPLSAIVVFVIIWWCVFFAVLPWGVKSRWEDEDDGVAGAEPGAPTRTELKKKLITTTLITVGLWAVAVAIILSGVINYRD